MPDILLTGGSGFIGSYFHQLIPHERLVNLDLVEPAFMHNAIFVQGDIRKANDIRCALNKYPVKLIISLAAKHHDFGIGHDEYFDTNEDGTRTLCEAASEFGVKVIVFFSSVAVYGLRPEISNELITPKPDGPYGASKLAGERVLTEWAAEDPTRKVLIIRPTLVFGPGNLANMHNLIRQIDSRLFFHMAPYPIKSIAYVENVVAATMYLIERGLNSGVEIYNYADEPHLNTRQIAETIATRLGKKIFITLPKFIGVVLGLPFDLIIFLTGKNLPISSSRIKKLGTQTYHAATKIFNTGFKPKYTTIEGMQKMVDWYKRAS
jgi:GlcNAc-P-P-Und epimerase